MLYPRDLSRLRWNPAIPRVENFAIFSERGGGLPARNQFDVADDERSDHELLHTLAPVDRSQRCIRYLMACGHMSLPNHAICERGCLQAPAWGEAFRGKRDAMGGYSRGVS